MLFRSLGRGFNYAMSLAKALAEAGSECYSKVRKVFAGKWQYCNACFSLVKRNLVNFFSQHNYPTNVFSSHVCQSSKFDVEASATAIAEAAAKVGCDKKVRNYVAATLYQTFFCLLPMLEYRIYKHHQTVLICLHARCITRGFITQGNSQLNKEQVQQACRRKKKRKPSLN